MATARARRGRRQQHDNIKHIYEACSGRASWWLVICGDRSGSLLCLGATPANPHRAIDGAEGTSVTQMPTPGLSPPTSPHPLLSLPLICLLFFSKDENKLSPNAFSLFLSTMKKSLSSQLLNSFRKIQQRTRILHCSGSVAECRV